MSDFIQVFTTTASREEAVKITGLIVENRLAACGQVIGPAESTYWWEGKLEKSEEWLCLFKARAVDFEKIERAIREAHSYEVPEIIAVPITDGSRKYLDWLNAETGDRKGATG